jgi:hypothetical protein
MFFFVMLGELLAGKSRVKSRGSLAEEERREFDRGEEGLQSNEMAKTIATPLRDQEKRTLPEGWSSADDIRDFRGPLPEDDPDMVLKNGQYVPRNEKVLSAEEKEVVEALIGELRALPKGTTLTPDEVLAFVRRLPRRLDSPE